MVRCPFPCAGVLGKNGFDPGVALHTKIYGDHVSPDESLKSWADKILEVWNKAITAHTCPTGQDYNPQIIPPPKLTWDHPKCPHLKRSVVYKGFVFRFLVCLLEEAPETSKQTPTSIHIVGAKVLLALLPWKLFDKG